MATGCVQLRLRTDPETTEYDGETDTLRGAEVSSSSSPRFRPRLLEEPLELIRLRAGRDPGDKPLPREAPLLPDLRRGELSFSRQSVDRRRRDAEELGRAADVEDLLGHGGDPRRPAALSRHRGERNKALDGFNG